MTDISPVNGITIYPSVKAVIIWGGRGVSTACWLPPLSHGSSGGFCQGTHPASSCPGTSLAPNWFNKQQPGRHPAPCYYYVSAAITIRKQEPFRSTNTARVSLIYEDNNDNDPAAETHVSAGEYSQCTDWRSVFSKLPMRDCTSWICLMHTTYTISRLKGANFQWISQSDEQRFNGSFTKTHRKNSWCWWLAEEVVERELKVGGLIQAHRNSLVRLVV